MLKKTESSHFPTPRNASSGILTSQEILQKLMKKNQVVKKQHDEHQSKSPCSGWKSQRNLSSVKSVNKFRNQSNEDLQNTQKKPKHISHISSLVNPKEWSDKSNNCEKNFICNANKFLKEKTLESKLDKLCLQVNELKKKSEQLESQNKLLFDNLQKFQTERETPQERNTLLNRLDQMIEMQKKQEENLNYFKEFFEIQNNETRRIKTQQSQPRKNMDSL